MQEYAGKSSFQLAVYYTQILINLYVNYGKSLSKCTLDTKV